MKETNTEPADTGRAGERYFNDTDGYLFRFTAGKPYGFCLTPTGWVEFHAKLDEALREGWTETDSAGTPLAGGGVGLAGDTPRVDRAKARYLEWQKFVLSASSAKVSMLQVSTCPQAPDGWEIAAAIERELAATVGLLRRSLSEIDNLQKKLAAGEQEGWEGMARRTVLKRELAAALAAAKEVAR